MGDLEVPRDAAGLKESQGPREAVRRASSQSDTSLTELSAIDRSPARAGASPARGRTRSETSSWEATRTSTTPMIAGLHRPQRGSSRARSQQICDQIDLTFARLWREQPRCGRCNPAIMGVVGVLVASRELVSDRVRPRAEGAPARAGGRSNEENSVKEVSDRVEARRTASRGPWDSSGPAASRGTSRSARRDG